MSLLDEAIVDAITLKEAALKNAEAMVLERYTVDVKQEHKFLLENKIFSVMPLRIMNGSLSFRHL